MHFFDTRRAAHGVHRPVSTVVARIIENYEPRTHDKDVQVAIKEKINRLKAQKIWEISEMNSIPKDAYIFGGRFVFKLKSYGAPAERPRLDTL